MRSKFFAALMALAVIPAIRLFAVPTLQLDIVDGVYDLGSETTIATTPQFTLRALLNGSNTSATYYISAAIIPPVGGDPTAFGSFKFGADTIAFADMTNGTPPENTSDGPSDLNLGPHSIFPAYYTEFSFTFTGASTIPAYDTQTGDPANGDLYFKDFAIDVTGLLAGYVVHFDLYNEYYKNDKMKLEFSPYSHDAQSGTNRVPDNGVTLMLFGVALVALAGFGVARTQNASRVLATSESRRR